MGKDKKEFRVPPIQDPKNSLFKLKHYVCSYVYKSMERLYPKKYAETIRPETKETRASPLSSFLVYSLKRSDKCAAELFTKLN